MNGLAALAMIAEKRIEEASRQGCFDNLPGAGKPLVLEDLSAVPEDLRMAYKILKNSGCLPPEIEERKEMANLVDILDNCPDEQVKLCMMRKLRVLVNKINLSSRRHLAFEENDDYYRKILVRLEKHERENSGK